MLRINIKKVVLIGLLLLILVVVLMVLFSFNISELFKVFSNRKIITKNPNFYPDMTGWEGSNYDYDSQPLPRQIGATDGIVILNPRDVETPAFIFQQVKLESGKNYTLKARIANIAQYSTYYLPENCYDSIIVLKLTDKNAGDEMIIFNDTVNTDDGWKTISAGVTNFGGRDVLLEAYGYAGGPCGSWSKEISAVDYFYIEQV